MTARIVNGRLIAQQWLADLREQVDALGVPLNLAAVCVDGDPALRTFVKLKQRAAQVVGIQFSEYFFDANDEAGARATLEYLASDPDTHGILIELPVPPSWNREELTELIPKDKDVDLLSAKVERSFYDDASIVLPPAVVALRRLFEVEGIEVTGRTVVVVGQGRLVGLPIAHWLRGKGAQVETIDINTPEPAVIASQADIIIAGAGAPELITDKWIREGVIVIDFGYKDGKGDVNAAAVQKKAGLLTPVPGGMGPLVVAAVLENVLTLSTQ